MVFCSIVGYSKQIVAGVRSYWEPIVEGMLPCEGQNDLARVG